MTTVLFLVPLIVYFYTRELSYWLFTCMRRRNMFSLKKQLELDGYIEVFYKPIRVGQKDNNKHKFFYYRNPAMKGDIGQDDMDFLNEYLKDEIPKNNDEIEYQNKKYTVKTNKNKRFIRIIDTDKCEYIDCNSVNGFLNSVKELKGKNEGKNIYFRGQASFFSWIPSLYREDEWIKNEFRLNSKVISKHVDEFLSCKSTIERLIKLKHFNQPSRLLDIVANPLMALYFACESSVDNNSYGVVSAVFSKPSNEKYSLYSDTVTLLSNISKVDFSKYFKIDSTTGNIIKCEKNEYDLEQIKEPYFNELGHQAKVETGIDSYFTNKENELFSEANNCIVVHPELNNPRVIQQQGMFILCGFDCSGYKSLPEECYNKLFLNSDGKRIYFLFSDKAMKNIKKELDSYGINRSQVYFDLEKTIDYEKNKVLGKI